MGAYRCRSKRRTGMMNADPNSSARRRDVNEMEQPQQKDMLGISFGWPKASKCKKVIKTARCRLRQLKIKRQATAMQMRQDLADLILNGHKETAFKRVEQLIQDEDQFAAYELLDHFFEFILMQLSYIRKHKDCPDDIKEAVSSLIFASARCGDFPELHAFRKLFGHRFGKEFAAAAVELLPGNLVNKMIKENLEVKSVPDDLKYRVVAEIARENGLQPKVKEYKGNQLVESDVQIIDTIAGSKIHPSEVGEIERDVTCVSLSITKSSDAFSLPESTLNDTSALVSTVQQYPSYLSLQKKVEEAEDFPKLILLETSNLQNKGEIMALSSSERVRLFPYTEAVVGYVDEIEECQHFVSKDGSCLDQRLLLDSAESDMDQGESNSEKSSIRSYTKRKRASKKRLRRSASLESQGIMEIGYVIYYQKPRRQQKKPLLERIAQSSYPQKRLKQHSSSEKGKCIQSCQSQGGRKRSSFNFYMSGCSLDSPCYCCVYFDQESWEALSMKPKKGIIRCTPILQGVLLGEFCHCRPLCHDESNEGMELVAIPQKLKRESCGAAGYHLLTYPDVQSGKPNNDIEASESLDSSSSTNVSNPKTSDSSTKTETATPYSRALTMPPKWPNNCEDNLLRTYSSTSQQPKHVHPKLPDYDNFVATFTALKREYASRG